MCHTLDETIGTMKSIFILLICIIVDSQSVSVDYYLGNKDPEIEVKNVNITLSKPLDDVQVFQASRKTNKNEASLENVTEPDYEKYDELSDIEEQMIKKASKDKRPVGENRFDSESQEIQVGFDTNVILRQSEMDVSKANTLRNILKDYVNDYDVPTTAAYTILRGNELGTETQTVFGFNKIVIIKNVTEDDINSEKMSIDFYNLIPASSVNNDFGDNFSAFNLLNNVWYVPENYPCWELPILYGELGKSMLATDVFLVYPGNLKNVIETEEELSQPSRSLYIPVSQTMNKWCAAGPCYGDHTLCLFSDKTNSKLCRRGYTVSTPTMIEQIGLVNTVNSMRNRIANGETDIYKHLPKAADMNQLIYDFDLESMAEAWLHQCLPGPAACSALDGNYVTQLECTKHAKHCCIDSYKTEKASKWYGFIIHFINNRLYECVL